MGDGGEGGDKERGNVVGAGMLYKADVKSVLLYGRKSWVVMGYMLKVLEGFHHWSVRRIEGMAERHKTIGEWECPPVD